MPRTCKRKHDVISRGHAQMGMLRETRIQLDNMSPVDELWRSEGGRVYARKVGAKATAGGRYARLGIDLSRSHLNLPQLHCSIYPGEA